MAKKTRVTIDTFAQMAFDVYGRTELKRAEIKAVAEKNNVQIPGTAFDNKVTRGVFDVSAGHNFKTKKVADPVVEEKSIPAQPTSIQAVRNAQDNFFIDVDPNYVPWGNFKDISTIIKSKKFFPVFVTGLSGNGKTTGIEQACAKLGRECIRVNFDRGTTDLDLIGGMSLVNGDTVFQYGPVVEAYMRGAVLILDEIDLASHNVMCLQAVLEGKPIFIKKLGKKIYPEKGFTVFATANTKGKGSHDGRFAGTNVLNEAFLDRFPITIEQNYPSLAIERKILAAYSKNFADEITDRDSEIIENLVRWAQTTRKSFFEGSIDELVSTRRLVATLESYFIFGDIKKAISYATNRFDEEIAESFVELYQQIDEGLVEFDEEENA